jgi:hypothetical protein
MNIKKEDDPNAMLFDEKQEGFVTRERSNSRTMTITSNGSNDSFTTSVYAPEEKVKKICGLPVKHGVTVFNLMAIILVPLCMMLIITFLNAQVILLLASPDYFNVAPANQGAIAG